MHQHHSPGLRTRLLRRLHALEQATTTLGSKRQVGAHLSRQLLIGEVDQAPRHQRLAQRLFNDEIDVITTAGKHHIGDCDVDSQRTLAAAQQRLLGQQLLIHQLAAFQTNRDLFTGLEGIAEPLGFSGTPHPQAESRTPIRCGRCGLHLPGDLGEILPEPLQALGQHRLELNAGQRVERRRAAAVQCRLQAIAEALDCTALATRLLKGMARR